MAFVLGEGFVDIDLDDSKVKGRLSKIQGTLVKWGKRAAVAAGAAFAAGFAFAIREAMNAQAVRAKLAAVLKSTGEAAGFTADELDRQAGALQNLTGIGDEAIIRAQTVLATFTQIGEKTFPRATEAVLDLASMLSDDAIPAAGELKSAALQIGKALNDPIKGVSALGRAGIQFTDDQKDMIKALVESNKLFEAQDIILRELEKQFGGTARAVGDTAAGDFAKLKEEIGDLAAEIGTELLPVIRDLLSILRDIATDNSFVDWAKAAISAISSVSKSLDMFENDLARRLVEGGILNNFFNPAAIQGLVPAAQGTGRAAQTKEEAQRFRESFFASQIAGLNFGGGAAASGKGAAGGGPLKFDDLAKEFGKAVAKEEATGFRASFIGLDEGFKRLSTSADKGDERDKEKVKLSKAQKKEAEKLNQKMDRQFDLWKTYMRDNPNRNLAVLG